MQMTARDYIGDLSDQSAKHLATLEAVVHGTDPLPSQADIDAALVWVMKAVPALALSLAGKIGPYQ